MKTKKILWLLAFLAFIFVVIAAKLMNPIDLPDSGTTSARTAFSVTTTSRDDGAVGLIGIVSSRESGRMSAGIRGQNEGRDPEGQDFPPPRFGVWGTANGRGCYGVYGTSNNGYGVVGESTNGTGVYGRGGSDRHSYAGFFDGTVNVNGQLKRFDHDFSQSGARDHGQRVYPPRGSIGDWNIFVTPRGMGREETGSERDNALIKIECWATPQDGYWLIHAKYWYRFGRDRDADEFTDGSVNYILVPR
jgi:hypothetical protein